MMGLLDWLMNNDPNDVTELRPNERRPVTKSPPRGAEQRSWDSGWRVNNDKCDEAVNEVRKKWRPGRK